MKRLQVNDEVIWENKSRKVILIDKLAMLYYWPAILLDCGKFVWEDQCKLVEVTTPTTD